MKYSPKIIYPLFGLSACNNMPSYSTNYGEARQEITGIVFTHAQAVAVAERFIMTFNTLGSRQFIDNATSLYAEQLYINDTLSLFSSRADLIEHFKSMNKRVSHVTIKLINTTYVQDSAYVHWYMAYDLTFLGRTKTMSSHGISEIKVNTAQQIIFQQDFWDSSNGLYRSLPYIGTAYAWLLPFKKES